MPLIGMNGSVSKRMDWAGNHPGLSLDWALLLGLHRAKSFALLPLEIYPLSFCQANIIDPVLALPLLDLFSISLQMIGAAQVSPSTYTHIEHLRRLCTGLIIQPLRFEIGDGFVPNLPPWGRQ